MYILPSIKLLKKKHILQVEKENLIHMEGGQSELANCGQVLGQLPPHEFVNAS